MKIRHMKASKYVWIPVVSFGIGTSACSHSQTNSRPLTQQTQVSVISDTLRRNQLQERIELINKEALRLGQTHKIPFGDNPDSDSLQYWVIQDRPCCMSLQIYPGRGIIWPIFTADKDGQLLFVQYKTITPKDTLDVAREEMIYLDQGKVFYCDERNVTVREGRINRSLWQQPFAISPRPLSEIEAEVLPYWQKALDTATRHWLSMKGK